MLVAVLCLGFTPGLGELLLDGIHVATDGHTHHAAGHAEPAPEHGCTGWQHTCSCHHSLSIAPVPRLAVVFAAPWAEAARVPCLVEKGPRGVRVGLDRPPRA